MVATIQPKEVIMDTKDNDAKASISDEIAAAEAELRAAQEKLDAAKAKASLEEVPTPGAERPSDGGSAASAEAADGSFVEAVPVTSSPIELEAEPVSVPEANEQDPNWVPYAPAAEQAQATSPDSASSYADRGASQGSAYSYPGQAAPQEPVNPYAGPQQDAAQPQSGYYWQQPQQDAYSAYNTQYNQYGQPQNPYSAPPQQQYYQQPYAPVVASKDHVAAGLLAIFLGSLGIHKFYLGYNTAGFIMLAVTILGGLITLGLAAAVMGVIAFIEGILYLVKSQSEFEQIYVFNKREWF